MLTEPRVVQRADQPYVAIRALVTMQELGAVVPPLNKEVFGWLAARGGAAAGAPFWKYNVIDMERRLEVEAGTAVAAAMPGDDRVLAGVIPGGRYATVRYTGHPAGLADATSALLAWAAEQGLAWDVAETEDGQRWGRGSRSTSPTRPRSRTWTSGSPSLRSGWRGDRERVGEEVELMAQ